MARLRSMPAESAAVPYPQTKRQALREKTNTTRAKVALAEEDVGNIEGLIKEAPKRKGRAMKSVHDDGEVFMAGGLGQGEARPTAPRSGLGPISTDELAKSDAAAPPTSKANKRAPRMMRKPIQNEAHSKVLDGLRKRMEETARKEGGKNPALPLAKRLSTGTAPSSDVLSVVPVTVRKSPVIAQERSEYDISPSPPPPAKLSSLNAKRSTLPQPTSSPKPRSTPAMDTSVLKNFKRRARQPSMLALVQQRAMNTRPSMTNATVAVEDSSIFDFDAENGEDEDDFAPEVEGTPLHVSEAKRKSAGSSIKKTVPKPVEAKPASAGKKRKSAQADFASSALETLRSKRRKSGFPGPSLDDEDNPLPNLSHSSVARGSPAESTRQATPVPQATSDVQVFNSSQSTPPPIESASPHNPRASVHDDFAVPSTEEQDDEASLQRGDDILENPLYDAPNGTMAEPASSSPVPGPLSGTQQRIRDELADPVTQVSPQRVVEKAVKPTKTKPISTATLQNLLPKRRQPLKPRHRKSEYDFASESENGSELDRTHIAEGEEEPNERRRRQTKVTPAKGRRKPTVATTAKAKKAGKQRERQSETAPASKKATKTYGRAARALKISDKENDDTADQNFDASDNGDESAEILPGRVDVAAATLGSGELEEARRKFAEVDGWDMEFETVGPEEHRSSSQQWR
ncbi:hypothetical protein LTR91_023977 [Friedmanniomyces endolithicus]|uniref:Uncharacterized protein n=1 Tax=Friedmanniomyces endolithicus TaxID=329885 RepID=A0AAN6H7W9_9PEZI|nr:hypothetical protein LTR35_002363 [Friedmanniomyces endolithicus]KAK0295875.1 hypothetical protein LTS00_005616 [Friedmanniomyces endolithicus]KAK0325846.1 hypothetical protein LTR82_003385 [Friedmanniomyces endolithicus]KAK0830025.1 hypothetical protein LTR73_004164 [Friedmanniomyces endolithicus]KAK0953202.1 hypothetical protein LTR91_023977 [Friedmanniomyces endolithicus]